MRRLIRADLHNLFKDKTFLIISVFSFVLGVFMKSLVVGMKLGNGKKKCSMEWLENENQNKTN